MNIKLVIFTLVVVILANLSTASCTNEKKTSLGRKFDLESRNKDDIFKN